MRSPIISLILIVVFLFPSLANSQNWNKVDKIKQAIENFQWADALSLLRQDSIELNSSEKGGAVFNALRGSIHLNQDQIADAAACLDKSISFFRNNSPQAGETTNMVEEKTRLQAYVDWADAYSEIDANQGLNCIHTALSYFESRNMIKDEEYISLLISLMQIDPSNQSIQKARAQLLKIRNTIADEDYSLWGKIYLCQSIIAVNQGNITAAKESLNKSINFFKKYPNYEKKDGYIGALGNLSSISYYSGDYEAAKQYLLECYSLMHVAAPAMAAKLSMNFAETIISDGRIDDAISFAQKARNDYLALNDPLHADAIKSQIDNWKNLSKTSKFTDDGTFSIQNIMSKGLAEFEEGRIDAAIQIYNQALQMIEDHINEGEEMLSMYANQCQLLANAYAYIGNLQDAETIYNKGLSTIKKVDESSWIYRNLLYGLGLYYTAVMDATHAWETFNELKYQYEKNYDFSSSYYTMLIDMANLSGRTNDHVNQYLFSQMAIEYFSSNSSSLNNDYDLMRAYQFNAKSAALLNNNSVALSSIQKAQRIAESHKEFEPFLPTIYHTMGTIDLALNKKDANDQTAKYFRKAYELQRDIDSGEAWAAIEYAHGNDRLCRETTATVCNMIKENVLSLFSFMPSAERETYWQTMQYNLLLDNSLLLHSSENDTQALQTIYDNLLFSKGLLLKTSNLISAEIKKADNSEDNDLYQRVQNLYTLLDDDQLSGDSKRQIKEEIKTIEKSLSIKYASIDNLQKYLSKSWKDVQKQLDGDEVAIEFALLSSLKRSMPFLLDSLNLNNDYYAFIINKQSKAPIAVRLCSDRTLQQLLEQQGQETEEWISRVYPQSESNQANELLMYKYLWHAIDSVLDGHVRTIYYSPYGGLNAVSFAAINDGKKCLAEKYELHQVSTTGDIADVKAQQKPSIHSATIYGGILYDIPKEKLVAESHRYSKPSAIANQPNAQEYMAMKTRGRGSISGLADEWGYLEGTQAEANKLKQCMEQQHLDVLLLDSTRANEESLKALSGKPSNIIHIATHGFYVSSEKDDLESIYFMNQNKAWRRQQTRENAMLRSGLVFAGANRAWTGEDIIEGIEDGIATAEEISQLDLRGTDLVTLSACQSGLGDVQSSEGVFGLQRAFKMAGVQSLIVSLWPVSDDVTIEFMEIFYSQWLNGSTKDAAFRKAQSEIKKTYKNPFYWAAFVMID